MRMQVLLPNGVKILAVDTTPISSIKTVWFYYGDNWYVKCPPSKVGSTESSIKSANTEESSTESTIGSEPEFPTEFDENHHIDSSDEANSIVGQFWVHSKAKISNIFASFNLTLS